MPATWIATRDVPLSDLQQFPGNARRGNIEEIRASLRRHGQYRALVVRDTGTALVILAGNHTAEALLAEGHDTARCELIECTDDEARRINLADNRTSDLATYDDRALAELLAALEEEDITGTGFGLDDLEDLLAGADAVPELPPPPPGAPPPGKYAESPEQLADRGAHLSGTYTGRPAGTAEIILVFTVAERDEYAALVTGIRRRDGDDLSAAQITLAALRAYTPPAP